MHAQSRPEQQHSNRAADWLSCTLPIACPLCFYLAVRLCGPPAGARRADRLGRVLCPVLVFDTLRQAASDYCDNQRHGYDEVRTDVEHVRMMMRNKAIGWNQGKC